MSQENVEIVRQAFEASVRRDNEAVFARYDPEIEVDYTASGRRGVYRGLEGVREWFRDWMSAFEDRGWEIEEWVDRASRCGSL
jgi:ketosteroid isomerase-like protein